ncbi:MAG: hypothetical protein ACOYM0_16565 [Bacteroidales bacterium]
MPSKSQRITRRAGLGKGLEFKGVASCYDSICSLIQLRPLVMNPCALHQRSIDRASSDGRNQIALSV